jgi:hypothetical protein
MSTTVTVRPDAVDVDFSGVDAALALKRHLTIAAADVESAAVKPVKELKRNLGLRVGGGYFPGWFATGHFLSRGGMKGRQLWSVYRDPEALVIELRGTKLRRVVVQNPDRVALAAKIDALASR